MLTNLGIIVEEENDGSGEDASEIECGGDDELKELVDFVDEMDESSVCNIFTAVSLSY